MTDLDGTALVERDGRLMISYAVELALFEIASHRPIVFNTLRFPRSVLDAFARVWLQTSRRDVALVALNGTSLGHLSATGYRELAAFPLERTEIDEVLEGIEGLVENEVRDLLLFIYPRDWERGEIIWTPDAVRHSEIAAKFPSASSVDSGALPALRSRLHAEPICMLHVRIDTPYDHTPAFQRVRPSEFITHAHTDKLSGAAAMADLLGFELESSIGAGDTPLDAFLSTMGLAVHVGPLSLEHKGRFATLKAETPEDFGAILQALIRHGA
ncbi:MAG: HAD family phosphatase [Hyphomicrobiales bacterium]|nr:HAD family phosphatase [Hyphomicrobiales bacterium]